MTMPIGSITTATPSIAGPRPSAGAAAQGTHAPQGFGDSLNALLDSVDESAGAANTAVGNMLEGKGDVHQAMIALQRAENSLQLTVQIRNKLVQAYQDVMRMTI